MASIVGIVLWRIPGVRRLAVGPFLIVTPVFILPAVLMSVGREDLVNRHTVSGSSVLMVL